MGASFLLYLAKKKRSMEDIQQQLAALRRRIANIGRASDLPAPRERRSDRPERYAIEEFMSGEVVHTTLGELFETERVWERHRCHGSVDISDLAELPVDLLERLSDGSIASAHPVKLAF